MVKDKGGDIVKNSISDNICILLVAIICVIVVCIFVMRNKDQLEFAYSYDISGGWTYEDGSQVILSDLQRGKRRFEITRTISESEQHDKSLCFYTKNIYFDVYCDGVRIYHYAPRVQSIFGKAYGVYMHHMDLPSYDSEAELKFVVIPIYKDSANFIRDIMFIDGGTFVRKELFKDLVGFVMCIIIFLYGGILFVMGVMGKNLKEKRREIIAVGAFSIVSAAFIVTDVQILQLFTGNPIIVHFMDYIALMLLSYPAIVYVACATRNERSKSVTLVGIMTAVNFIVQLIISGLGISDYHEMLHITHVVIIVAVVFVIILIAKGIKRDEIDHKIYRYLIIAFGITALTGGYDVIIYSLHKNQRGDGGTFRFGMFAFILLIGTYEITVILELTRKGQNAEIMEQLAYHDVLTGLMNRQAYMREEYRLRNEKDGEYIFMMFDVNNLKKMNDTYGHGFGDELIKGASEVIEKSFAESGMCFRTGGDEFFVIYSESLDEDGMEVLRNAFEHNIQEYNDRKKLPLPLSIAYGYARYEPGKDRFEDVEKAADDRMYNMKAQMKVAMAQGMV